MTLKVGKWSYEAAQIFLARMRTELKDLKIHAYLDVTVVHGRKPGGKPALVSPPAPQPFVSTIPEDYQSL